MHTYRTETIANIMGFRRNVERVTTIKGGRERERGRDGERQAEREGGGGAYHLHSSLKLGDLISTCRDHENCVWRKKRKG